MADRFKQIYIIISIPQMKRITFNQVVVGSIPTGLTNKIK
jgi:hypothetical protein